MAKLGNMFQKGNLCPGSKYFWPKAMEYSCFKVAQFVFGIYVSYMAIMKKNYLFPHFYNRSEPYTCDKV